MWKIQPDDAKWEARSNLFQAPVWMNVVRAYELSRLEWEAAGISQLRMGYRRFDRMPAERPVEGYEVRAYTAGDEAAWVGILSAGDFGLWDRARLDRMIAGERAPLPLEGVRFATHRGAPVGVANTFLYEGPEGHHSELGWVAVDPAHRGRGVSYEVCRSVLDYARSIGHRYTYLKTEDFRLGAIKTYLRLGFEPELLDATQPPRWEELRRVLGVEGRTEGA